MSIQQLTFNGIIQKIEMAKKSDSSHQVSENGDSIRFHGRQNKAEQREDAN